MITHLKVALCKNLVKITREVNKVIGTIQAVTIEDTRKLLSHMVKLLKEELSYDVKSSADQSNNQLVYCA